MHQKNAKVFQYIRDSNYKKLMIFRDVLYRTGREALADLINFPPEMGTEDFEGLPSMPEFEENQDRLHLSGVTFDETTCDVKGIFT